MRNTLVVMLESPTLPPARDRRVRRSRAVLMAAAVTLVSERGTADVPVAEIADTADVSRRLVYQQFHDRETLLLEAALDLARRELLPRFTEDGPYRMPPRHWRWPNTWPAIGGSIEPCTRVPAASP